METQRKKSSHYIQILEAHIWNKKAVNLINNQTKQDTEFPS